MRRKTTTEHCTFISIESAPQITKDFTWPLSPLLGNGLNQLTSMIEKNKVNGQFQQVASTTYTYDLKGNLTQDNETRGTVETDVNNTYTVDSLLAGTSIQVGTENTWPRQTPTMGADSVSPKMKTTP